MAFFPSRERCSQTRSCPLLRTPSLTTCLSSSWVLFCTLFQFVLSATAAQGYQISLANVPGFGRLAATWDMWGYMNYGCMNFMAVAIVFLVSLHYAENLGMHGDRTVASVALACFVTLINTGIKYTPEGGEAINVATGVTNTYTNAQGLFVALIVGILATLIYTKLLQSGKLTLHLPDSVPPNVAHSFAVLFPAVITVFCFGLLRFFMDKVVHLNFFDLIAEDYGSCTGNHDWSAWLPRNRSDYDAPVVVRYSRTERNEALLQLRS